MDGDGFDDIAVGAVQYTDGKRTHLGAVEIYRGGRDGCEPTATWRDIGDRIDSHLGQLCAGGDLNGDGVPDLVVGTAYWRDTSNPQRGLILTYLGQRQTR